MSKPYTYVGSNYKKIPTHMTHSYDNYARNYDPKLSKYSPKHNNHYRGYIIVYNAISKFNIYEKNYLATNDNFQTFQEAKDEINYWYKIDKEDKWFIANTVYCEVCYERYYKKQNKLCEQCWFIKVWGEYEYEKTLITENKDNVFITWYKKIFNKRNNE